MDVELRAFLNSLLAFLHKGKKNPIRIPSQESTRIAEPVAIAYPDSFCSNSGLHVSKNCASIDLVLL